MGDGGANAVAVQGSRPRVSTTLLIAVIVGVGAHVAAFLLLRVDFKPNAPAAIVPAFVSVVQAKNQSGNPVVSEQLEYLDPEPLFMPTRWNAGDQPLPPDLRRQPDQAFQSFDPQMTFSYNKLEPVFAPPQVAFEDPIRVLALGGVPRFSAVGRKELLQATMEREAYVEVRRVSDGGIVHVGPLTGLPKSVREASWAPVEFFVSVNAAGLVGSPMVETGSGSTEIDDAIQTYLESGYRLGKRLSPGFYRVTVGP